MKEQGRVRVTVQATVAAALIGVGIGLLISPAFWPEFAGPNLLGFIPVAAGLWLIN